jgi:acyl-CoA synthetase (AMP-forming)/AMP-acid ligase II/thioesterase domain-containing protein
MPIPWIFDVFMRGFSAFSYLTTILRAFAPRLGHSKASSRITVSIQSPEHVSKNQETLVDLLEWAASRHGPINVAAYPEGNTSACQYVTYKQLKSEAEARSHQIRSLEGFHEGGIILLHFSNHIDNILWFWAVTYSGCIPAMSTPLPNDLDQRRKHLEHVQRLFEYPICLTSAKYAAQITASSSINVHAIESFPMDDSKDNQFTLPEYNKDDIAALMLTSGSTGNSKAVCLTHGQILSSVAGKSTIVNLPRDTAFFNWVGLDHVGALLEIHMEAMYLGMNQVHVQASDLVGDTYKFLELIDRHRVSRTFAPNFFLANLIRAMNTKDPATTGHLDLSCLRCLVSGGESNPVKTVEAASKILVAHGASEPVIFPGFGMTETCAGSIYNRMCPQFDLQSGTEYASLGHCVPGIEMRVTSQGNHEGSICRGSGKLEVRGPIVFKRYYNNPKATAEAINEDGWFDTGDEAMIDETGALHIVGRIKDTMNVNGVKFVPTDIVTSLDNSALPGAVASYYVCFSYRPPQSDTERLCILYLPTYDVQDIATRSETNKSIVKIVMLQTGTCPYVLPLDSTVLQKSTLGKLSTTKLRTAFIHGAFQRYEDVNKNCLELAYRPLLNSVILNQTETDLLEIFRSTLHETMGWPDEMIDVETPLLYLGVTSIHLMMLKRRIEEKFNLVGLSVIVLMTSPTVRSLATAIKAHGEVKEYNPVVKLQDNGGKAPLWLFHPGVGEILVFLGLSKYIEERPVYALRARGFNEGEKFFENIEETVRTYYTAIKKHQPNGPYALAGYSYGTMLAFETAKLLEQGAGRNNEVAFLGSFNLPPHIKFRMRQLDWTECMLHLAFFLDLISEDYADKIRPQMKAMEREAIAGYIINAASPNRLAELSMTAEHLIEWSDLSFALQSMASDYEPSGSVRCMDIFYCEPLSIVAPSKREWLDKHMDKWRNFTHEEPRFHEVGGAHYTMIGPDHVYGFQKKLRQAMAARNI